MRRIDADVSVFNQRSNESGLVMSSRLSLFGGEPAVPHPPTYSWPPITNSDTALIVQLLQRKELSYYGREGEVRELEDAFKTYFNVRFALAMSSGTAALHSAFFGLGLGEGDEVLAPTFTFLSTVMPIFVVNALPVLVDAEPDTGNIDPADIERRITPQTKALVITHMQGHACDMSRIMDLVRKHRLTLIEDCSHAHGASHQERLLGTFGDASVFSLQGSKLVAAGQGGILLTNDQEIYERATLLGHFKVRAMEEVTSDQYRPFSGTGYGLNYRMHPFAAGLAKEQFKRLDAYLQGRNDNLLYLSSRLKGIPGIAPPVVRDYATRHGWFTYRPFYKSDELEGLSLPTYLKALQAEGVPIQKASSLPLHLEPLFQVEDDHSYTYGRTTSEASRSTRQRYQPGDLPHSEHYAQSTCTLPPFTEPMPEIMDQFADAFSKVAEQAHLLRDYERTGYHHTQ
jgi:perosamine synthetase